MRSKAQLLRGPPRRKRDTASRTGQLVPFRAPSNDHGYPRMPVRSRANFLSFFAMHCATVASCWRRLWSPN